MLRRLMIRFKDDGDYFREIDEDRNYFFTEAEGIIDRIRDRLAKEKRASSTKSFEFWIDGQCLVISQVHFEKKESLQRQLEHTILTFDNWEEDIRHKYVNTLKEYIEEEKQLFINKEFATFAIRYDQIFGISACEPFPIYLDGSQLNQIYGTMQPLVRTGFYAELEQMMAAIKTATEKLVLDAQKTLESDQKDFSQQQKLLEEKVNLLFREDTAFKQFTQYAGASFQSVGKHRIEALCPNFKQYQTVQLILFSTFVEQNSFAEAYEIHLRLVTALKEKYDAILSQGFSLANDEMIESLVLSPILQQYKLDIEKQLQRDEVKEDEPQ
ncbi:hypothetical protein [Lysinibacillus capsici]|uniref:hypothetical protein n=1 Tax=Lysinibacillus capsici TaxID=2115968 RepID=UPI003081C413|nr:hypothetical protein ICJ70_13810 [Lysinibacillus capsici]